MEGKNQKEQGISIADLLGVLRGGIIWIIGITFVCLALGFFYAFGMQETSYTAKLNAYYYVTSYETSSGEKVEVQEHTRYQYSALLAQDCEAVFKSNDIVSEVVPQIQGINIGAIKFEVVEDSPLFTVSYTVSKRGGDANAIKQEVADMLNAYVNASIEVINDNTGEPHWHKDKIFVNSFASKDTVSTNTGRGKIILLSLAAGLVIAVVFVLIKHFLDDTVTSREQVEAITDTQIIALIDISANMNDDVKVVAENKEAN